MTVRRHARYFNFCTVVMLTTNLAYLAAIAASIFMGQYERAVVVFCAGMFLIMGMDTLFFQIGDWSHRRKSLPTVSQRDVQFMLVKGLDCTVHIIPSHNKESYHVDWHSDDDRALFILSR